MNNAYTTLTHNNDQIKVAIWERNAVLCAAKCPDYVVGVECILYGLFHAFNDVRPKFPNFIMDVLGNFHFFDVNTKRT